MSHSCLTTWCCKNSHVFLLAVVIQLLLCFLTGWVLQSRCTWEPSGELYQICVPVFSPVLREHRRQGRLHPTGSPAAAVPSLLGLWNLYHLLYTYPDRWTIPCPGWTDFQNNQHKTDKEIQFKHAVDAVKLTSPLLISAPQPSNTCYIFMRRSKGGSTEATESLCKGGFLAASCKKMDNKGLLTLSTCSCVCRCRDWLSPRCWERVWKHGIG